MKKIKLGGIIEHKDLCLISIEDIDDRPGIAGLIFKTLGRQGVNVEFIIQVLNQQGKSQVIFGVAKGKKEQVMVLLQGLKSQIGNPNLMTDPEIAVLSIFGPHFRELPGIAGLFFTALHSKGINIMAISTSISTCSCVIPAESLPEAVKALGETFEVPGGET
ncbi:MAG: ACT domain-containing protein [Thermodesulfobacteriota bacterium]